MSEREQRLRELHRQRLWAYDLPASPDHEIQVVGFALRVLDGEVERPLVHEHYIEEMGWCLHCDTGALVETYEHETGSSEGGAG